MKRSAFRCLGLLADSSLKEIRKRQNQIEVMLQIGELPQSLIFKDLVQRLDGESVNAAVHLLEHGQDRIREELEWLHSINGLNLFEKGPIYTSDAIKAYKELCAGKDERSAIARHNLAVIYTLYTVQFGDSDSTKLVDFWREALGYWRQTYQDHAFWLYLEERVNQIGDDSLQVGDLEKLRRDLPLTIFTWIDAHLAPALRQRKGPLVRQLTSLVREANWLSGRSAKLDSIAFELIRSAEEQLEAKTSYNPEEVAAQQVEVQRQMMGEMRDFVVKVITSTNTSLRDLTPSDSVNNKWGDTAAKYLKRLSVGFFRYVGDPSTALALSQSALTYAKSSSVREPLAEDIKFLEFQIEWRKAQGLAESNHYGESLQSLLKAQSIAPADWVDDVEKAIEICRKNMVLDKVDTSQTSPSLATVNGFGTHFYGKRDFDAVTGSYITTHWLVALFIPLIPLGAYRVVESGPRSYRIFGRVPLSDGAKWYGFVVAAAAVILFMAMIINSDDQPRSSAPSHQTQGTSLGAGSQTSSNGLDLSAGGGNSTKYLLNSEREQLDRRYAELQERSNRLDAVSSEIDALSRDIQNVKNMYPDGVPEPTYSEYQPKLQRLRILTAQFNQDVAQWNADKDQYNSDIASFNRRVRNFNAR